MGIIPQCDHGMSIGLCRVCFPLPKEWSKNMNIEAGKFYKTRAGRKVRIYSTKGNFGNDIHGAVFWNNWWTAEEWTENGFWHKDEKESPLDIIYEWED